MAEHAGKNQTEAPAGTGKTLSRAKIAIIVAVIVAAQCLLAYMFLPSGSKAEAGHKEKEHEQTSAHGEHKSDAAHEQSNQREVDLGQFSLTSFDPASNSTMLIDFHIYGLVVDEPTEGEAEGGGHGGGHGHGGKGEEAEDLSKFGKLYKKNKFRFRDQVIMIIRNAELTDLTDPGLGLIKRQILAKTNALVGEPLLLEVIFSDFAVVEQ